MKFLGKSLRPKTLVASLRMSAKFRDKISDLRQVLEARDLVRSYPVNL
jgi:hypothetical protein